MIGLLISVLIILLIAALLFWVISLLPLPAPWGRIFQAVIGVIVLIWLIEMLLGHGRLLAL